MQFEVLAIVISCTLLPAAMIQAFPLWQRSFLFTVRVGRGFPESPEARRIIARFRTGIWMAAVICAAGMSVGAVYSIPAVVVGVPFANCAAIMAVFFRARSRTLPFAEPAGGTVRRAALTGAASDCEPWWTWAAPLVGIALLGSAAVLLAVNWERIPDPTPVHWGLDGRPNRWAPKSGGRAVALFLCGLSTQALTTLILFALGRSGPPSVRRRLNQAQVAGVILMTSGILSAVLLLPLRGAVPLPNSPWLTIAPMVLMTAPVIWISYRLQRAELDEEEPTRDDKWIGGIFYADSADSRMMVPNRLGPGYGFNLGHPVMRIAFPGLILATLVFAFLPAVL